MSKIVVRPAKFGDISGMVAVNERNLPENYDLGYWKNVFPSGKSHSHVATSGGDIIGYVFCSDSTIVSFAIDEKYRQYGLGSELMRWVLNSFSVSKKSVKLHVRVSNTAALALYTKFGFVETAHCPSYYTTEDGLEMTHTPIAVAVPFPTVKKLTLKPSTIPII
jgi:ribosomal protein S18 acetylase RimI-like enzyme